ncbi:MAG: AraC family transcriptional regulator [Deltaproteobacteria bacterium]|nr:AraC family transcriptional regulator [Deltaproteobacteria bacterium]
MRKELPIAKSSWGFIWHHDRRAPMCSFHSHDEVEGNIVVRGTASYRIFGRRVDLQRHSMLWLFPDQEHMLFNTSPDFEMWIWVIRPHVLRNLCNPQEVAPLLERNPADLYLRTIDARDAEKLIRAAKDGAAVTPETDLHNAELLRITSLAWQMWRKGEGADPLSTKMHPTIARALHVLGEADADCTSLAKRVRVSPTYLSRLFHKEMGIPLIQYRNQLRIQRFLSSYQRGERANITEAALRAGFGSYPQFHRVFTSTMGQSPSKFIATKQG